MKSSCSALREDAPRPAAPASPSPPPVGESGDAPGRKEAREGGGAKEGETREGTGAGAPAPADAASGAGTAGTGGIGRRPSAFELDIGGIIAKSTVMAVIFAAPPIAIFLALHHYTGSVLAGAVVGFGAHFAILAFSPRIAQLLIRGGPGAGKGG